MLESWIIQTSYFQYLKNRTALESMYLFMKKTTFPIHVSKETFKDQMNLLFITKKTLRSLNKFMYNQSKQEHRKHFCMYFFQCFSSENILEKHIKNCLTINRKQAIKMPEKVNNVLKYNNFHTNSCQFLSLYMLISKLTQESAWL